MKRIYRESYIENCVWEYVVTYIIIKKFLIMWFNYRKEEKKENLLIYHNIIFLYSFTFFRKNNIKYS